MTKSILLQDVSTEQLKVLMGEAFKDHLESFKKSFNTQDQEELLTREQTCEYLQIDSSTLWHWTNKGKVKAYGIGSRRYYKKAELLESLKPLNK